MTETNTKKRLCVVVPFRDRYAHLDPFIKAIKPILENQGIDFQILIVEQTFAKQFNRGMMKNIGYLHADADYYCFHDIDMVPVEADYSFVDAPTHIATNVEQFGWKLPYEDFFGGVILFSKEDFKTIQGYDNNYWGWGAEDDDLRARCLKKGLKTMRKPGKFSSLNHERPIIQTEYSANVNKYYAFLNNPNATFHDLDECKYTVLETVTTPDYTKITVQI